MQRSAHITTSWDDGNPLDLRVAELLARYDLPGTFYIPRFSQRPVMSDAQIRQLRSRFDVGAHTLNHVALTDLSPQDARHEIVGSKDWIDDVTGRACTVFCPPLGQFRREHLAIIRDAGIVGLRTVELLSLDAPRLRDGLLVMPTTVQAHPHTPVRYARNAVRRAAIGNLWRYVVHGIPRDWCRLARSLLETALRRGGVFHLWGHSWELEENAQWSRLEDLLRAVHESADGVIMLTNSELCAAGSIPALAHGMTPLTAGSILSRL